MAVEGFGRRDDEWEVGEGWQAGRLAGWQVGWLASWPVGWGGRCDEMQRRIVQSMGFVGINPRARQRCKEQQCQDEDKCFEKAGQVGAVGAQRRNNE